MTPFSLNIRGQLRTIDTPQVMAIMNVTPDSFFASSRVDGADNLARRAAEMLAEGADIIDVGGYSSRPGAAEVSEREEMERVERGVRAVRSVSREVLVSVDTFRASVARRAVEEWGADIVNDISGGDLDSEMFPTVAQLGVPYVVMHMRGTPQTMQSLTDYTDVTADVAAALCAKIRTLRLMGVADIIADPGFGFSKTLEQNYELFRNLPTFEHLVGCPMLVGISRKSMITRLPGISPEGPITPADSLPGTVALNTAALLSGAAILRVHDVAAAVQARAVALQLLKS